MMPTTISALLDTGHDSDAALIVGEAGKVVVFDELRSRVHALAETLAARGVARGDRVVLVIPDGPNLVQLLFAINALGASAAPLNPAYKHDEYAFYLDDLKPRFLLLPDGEIGAAREAIGSRHRDHRGGRWPRASRIKCAPRIRSRAPRGRRVAPAHKRDHHRPKQVRLAHANITASVLTIATFYGLTREDVSYCAMPLFHVHGLVASVWSSLAVGGCVVVPRRLTPSGFWAQAREHDATWFSAARRSTRCFSAAPRPTRSSPRSGSSGRGSPALARAEDAHGGDAWRAGGRGGRHDEGEPGRSGPPAPSSRPRLPGSVGVPTGVELQIVDSAGPPVGR